MRSIQFKRASLTIMELEPQGYPYLRILRYDVLISALFPFGVRRIADALPTYQMKRMPIIALSVSWNIPNTRFAGPQRKSAVKSGRKGRNENRSKSSRCYLPLQSTVYAKRLRIDITLPRQSSCTSGQTSTYFVPQLDHANYCNSGGIAKTTSSPLTLVPFLTIQPSTSSSSSISASR